MRDLRDLFHAAGSMPGDPFDEAPVRRKAAERRHLSRVAAAVAVTMALIAVTGIGVRLVATGHKPIKVITRPEAEPAVRGPDERGLSQWTVPGATAVTLSGDDLWVVGHSASRGGPWYVARLDRSTGKERARIAISHVVERVVVGLGLVWCFGGGDATEPNGGVTVVDPDRRQVVAAYGYDHPFSPSGLTFVDKSAVVSDTTGDRVLAFDSRPGNLAVAASYRVGHQPTDLVAPSGSSLWVRESGAGTISRVPVADPARTAPWVGHLLAPAGASQIWATEGDGGRLVQLNPELLAQGSSVALGARIAVQATAVAADTEGVWVGGPTGVSRFVRRALESAGDPKPAAVLAGYRVSSLAGNTQGVWFTAQERGTVYRWVPKDLVDPEPSVEAGRRGQKDGPDTFVAVEASRLAVFDAYTGRRLRFLTDGQAGGGDSSPALADDGTVFFVRGNGTCSSGIWRLPPGGREVRVVQPADGAVSQVAVSPDGRMLAWVEQRCGDVAALKTRNLGTGAESSFAMDAPPSVEGRPAWSPDNRHLAYFYGRRGGGVGGVRVLDTGSAASRADQGMALQGRECPQWSPAFLLEGTLVVLTCRDPAHLDRIEAVRFDPATGRMLGNLFTLANPAGPAPELFLVSSFDFSGPGRHALYQIDGQGEAAHSRTFRWDGTSPSLISTDAREPVW